MRHPGGSSASRRSVWRGLAVVVGAVLPLASMAAAWQTHRQIDARLDDRLGYEAARIDAAIEQRMLAYVQVLRGGVGLFEASDEVTSEEWVRYVDTLQVEERYPGFKSLSFAQAVPADALDAFVAEVRADPVPPGMADPTLLTEYSLRAPDGVSEPTPIHSPIRFVAPFVEANQRVLGVDMMVDPVRRPVMEAAAASDDAVFSPRIRLAGQVDEQAGFIAYVAVRRDGVLLGWLTAAFRGNDLFDGLLGDEDPLVEVEVHDGPGDGVDSLLWSTAAPSATGAPTALADLGGGGHATRSTVALPGREWSVRFVAAPGFTSGADRWLPWLVLAGGWLLSALVALVLRTGAGWRSQAEVLRTSEARVRHEATHDPLTGLVNRAGFGVRLEAAVAAGAPFAVAYVDIDGFKPVNDRFGHAAGDRLLEAIAGRLRAVVRDDDAVARLGGDEFALLLDPERAPAVADQLAARLSAPFDLDGVTAVVGASVGVARFPDDGGSADLVLGAADAAMYEVKRAGGGAARLRREPVAP